MDARRARGPGLPGAEPRGAQVDHPPLRHAAARVGRRDRQDHRGHPHRAEARRASRPRWSGGRRSPTRSGARWRRRRRASTGSPTSTASASSPTRSATATRRSARCTSAGRRCRGGSRTISASRSRTATARSTPRSRGATASGWRCRSAPRRCMRWRRPAWRRTGPTGTASGSRTRSRSIRSSWLRSITERFEGRGGRGLPRARQARDVHRTRCSASRPKGEVVKLPRGATPIDFAYAIHTRIGDSCVGAKVDGQRVPLWTKLRNGQSVTIIRAEGQRPQPSWEDMVVTGRAKAAIRRSLRGEQRATQVRLGREIARVALERVGKKATDKAMEAAARRLGLEEAEDVLARLGAAEMTGKELVATLYPELLREAALPRGADRHRAGGDRPRLGAGGAAGAVLQPDPRRADRRHRRARQGGGDPRHRLRRARRLRGGARPLDRPALGGRPGARRPRGAGRGDDGERRRACSGGSAR